MAAVTLQPMNERILVRPISFDDRRDTNILLPKNIQTTHQYCEVIAVGPGAISQSGERVTPTVAVGDKILMLPTHGTQIRIHGEDLKLTSEREILCKVVE